MEAKRTKKKGKEGYVKEGSRRKGSTGGDSGKQASLRGYLSLKVFPCDI